VKLIRPEVLGTANDARQSELHARFEREAQTTALLQSPHTIDLFDYGVTADGAFYYVMELLDGFDLKTLVERFGPVPVERAVNVLTQVCHSLAEAHAAGLVHRDITPSNVFVCRYGRDVDFVKVLDFGLVKPQPWGDDEDVGLTRANMAGGTPAFMAPEQALADRPLDGRSDLYAVGCLGYWLVTGELVFSGATPMATVVAHTQTPPVPPSQRTELPISEEFDALILECLAKQPEDRPPDAATLARRLRNLPGLAPWCDEQAHAWWNAHRPVDPDEQSLRHVAASR
jgi:serine/threonine-protein kinase